MDCGPPASSVHGILQARVLEQPMLTPALASSRSSPNSHHPCWGCEGAAASEACGLLNTLHTLSPRGPAIKRLGVHPKELKIYVHT